MSQVAQLLRAFDDSWSHECESLRSVLQSVISEESSWQDSSYAAERFVQGLPAPGTIRWQVAHLEHCARHYTAILRERPIVHEPLTPPPGTVDLPELIDRLERARQSLREEIVKLSDMDLEDQCARGMKVGEFLRMVIRHEAWHGGQLAVIRRLYRHKR
jgi:hypothetical protein